jgi:hypothetical protein
MYNKYLYDLVGDVSCVKTLLEMKGAEVLEIPKVGLLIERMSVCVDLFREVLFPESTHYICAQFMVIRSC